MPSESHKNKTKSLGHLPEKPWSRSVEEVAGDLNVQPESGLNADEVKQRRKRYGSNRLKETKRRSAWAILVDQVKSLIILLLVVAAVLSFSFGQWLEGISIVIAILLNGAIGFITELRAVRSMEALHRMTRITAKVRRGGQIQEVAAIELVPGDVIVLDGGDVVTADLRLTEASRLRADESALTGESVPVGKETDALEETTELADRKNMLFKGTAVTGGTGEGLVVATGMKTELGRISELTEEATEEVSPLEKRLNRLGRSLVWITLAIAFAVILVGLFMGRDLFTIVETAIALAVAAIPEGLPIVATIALARGMWRMAAHNALVNQLSAVETLGATNVICVDKTGTLTENRMTVTQILMAESDPESAEKYAVTGEQRDSDASGDRLETAITIGVLCNNAALNEESDNDGVQGVGDPMEVALLALGRWAGKERKELLEDLPEVREEAFDPATKMMATFHKRDDRYQVAVKGAPEAVLEVSSHIETADGKKELNEEVRDWWRTKNTEMAEEGLRVLAVAEKDEDDENAEPYKGLRFIGLVGFLDPPREEVPQSIARCAKAGIRVVMVTGDQAITAKNIAVQVGLVEKEDPLVIPGNQLKFGDRLDKDGRKRLMRANIFARVTPEQKLDLITLHQKSGSVVAMTGDGINDAPALQKADIGVAMGGRGTQVAVEAADMVLKDDAFATILVAIEQGRAIFDNLRKFILYLLSGNVSEIMIVVFALLVGAPLPLLPLQILYLNMIGDVFPALALGVGKGDPSKMLLPPRDPKEPIVARRHWAAIVIYGIVISTAVLTAFWAALNRLQLSTNQAVTISFLTLAFARLWHVFNMRDRGSGLIRNDVTRNPFVWGALVLCTGLLLLALFLPGLSLALDLSYPGHTGMALIVGLSIVPLIIGQIYCQFRDRK
jgi:Ca2+-transporting ATPase